MRSIICKVHTVPASGLKAVFIGTNEISEAELENANQTFEEVIEEAAEKFKDIAMAIDKGTAGVQVTIQDDEDGLFLIPGKWVAAIQILEGS